EKHPAVESENDHEDRHHDQIWAHAVAVVGPYQHWRTPCMGPILSRGCPTGPIDVFQRQFPCSTWTTRFLAPTHTERAAGARRSSQRMARERHPQGLVLYGSEHDGTLVMVGMTKSMGARAWCTNVRAACLHAAGHRPKP